MFGKKEAGENRHESLSITTSHPKAEEAEIAATRSHSSVSPFWKRGNGKEKLAAFGLLVLLALGALGAVTNFSGNNPNGILARIAETVGLKKSEAPLPAANGNLQLSKEYIYAGSRMLAIEDYGVTPSGTTPSTGSNTATFVRNDTSTQGNWIGNYGAQGYKIAEEGTSLPSWAQVTFNGQLNHVWAASTSDGRALKKAANNGDRIASTWYTSGAAIGGTYNVAFNFTDGQEHQLAFYNLDWDSAGPRVQQLEVLNGANGAVLDTRTINGFVGGIYTVWRVKGQVTVKVTNQLNNTNAVIGGFFIDDPNAPPPSGPPAVPSVAGVAQNSDPTCLNITLNGVSGAVSYDVKVISSGYTINTTQLSFPWCGLQPATYYEYQARAVGNSGTSGWSNAVGGTTASPQATPTPTPPLSVSLNATPSSVSAGGTAIVAWSANMNRPGSDWVGLFAVGAPNNAPLATQNITGGTSGSTSANMPMTAGSYEFRYFVQGEANPVAVSNTVTVTQCARQTCPRNYYWNFDSCSCEPI